MTRSSSPPPLRPRRRLALPLTSLGARKVADGERLSTVSHLQELRARVLWSLGCLITLAGVCFVFADRLFEVLNRPLGDRFEVTTLAVTEPFFTTLSVASYTAAMLALPVLTYHAYRYVAPALEPWQRKVARPFLVAVPLLFAAGVAFGYAFVLGPAVRFLLGFGTGSFEVQVRAHEYYSFAASTLFGIGLLFLYPLILLLLARLGVVTSRSLRANRRFALLGIAVVAALLPTGDPVSLAIEMLPLIALFELSVLLIRLQERSAKARGAAT